MVLSGDLDLCHQLYDSLGLMKLISYFRTIFINYNYGWQE